MRPALFALAANAVAITALVCAAHLFLHGIEHGGWFLLFAFFSTVTVRFKEDKE